MYKGYIKLYRKIRDNPLYRQKRRFSRCEAWIDLLLRANHKDTEINVGLRKITLKAGDIFTSQLELSKQWNWGIASVSRFLKYLYNEKQISYKAENKYSIISILNWHKYQDKTESKLWSERKPNGKVYEYESGKHKAKVIELKISQSGKQNGKQTENKTETIKKNKECKRNKELGILISYFSGLIKEKKGFVYKPTPQDIVRLKETLADYPLQEVREIITWYFTTEKSQKYCSLSSALSAHSLNLYEEEKAKKSWQEK